MAQSTLSESQSSAELIIQNREQGPITTDGQLGKEGMMNGTLTLSNHLAQRAPFLKTPSVCLHESRVLEQFYLTFFFSSLRMCFSTTSTNEVPAKRDHVQSGFLEWTAQSGDHKEMSLVALSLHFGVGLGPFS